jgi:hypothetical protein
MHARRERNSELRDCPRACLPVEESSPLLYMSLPPSTLWLAVAVGLAVGAPLGYRLGRGKTAPTVVEAPVPVASRAAPAIPPPPSGGTFFEDLQARGRALTQSERLAELTRYKSTDAWPGRAGEIDPLVYYQALIQPEDLPEVRRLLDAMDPGQEEYPHAYFAMLAAFARYDLPGYEAWVRQNLAQDREMRESVTLLARRWAEEDPQGAWDKAIQLHGDREGEFTNWGWMEECVAGSVRAGEEAHAFQKILALKEEIPRTYGLLLLVPTVARQDVSQALRLAEQVQDQSIRGDIISRIASSAPRTREGARLVADYILARQGTWESVSPMSRLLSTWKARDPQGMEAWVKQNAAALGIYEIQDRRRGHSEPTNEELVDAIEGRTVVYEISQRTYALGQLMQRDPVRGLEIFRRLDRMEQEMAQGIILEGLAKYDPALAASTLLETADLKEARKTAEGIMSEWMRSNSLGASRWADKLPAGPLKDGCIEAVVNRTSFSDPEAAAFWALQLSELPQQTSSLKKVLRDWAVRDSAAPRAWLGRQALDDAQRAELLRDLEGGPGL